MYLLLKMVFFHGHASFQWCRPIFLTMRHQVPETELRNIIWILWDAGNPKRTQTRGFWDPRGPNWNISLNTANSKLCESLFVGNLTVFLVYILVSIDDRWFARFFDHFREPCVTSLNRVCFFVHGKESMETACETSWWQVGFPCASLSLRLGQSKQISRQMIQVIQKWRSFLPGSTFKAAPLNFCKDPKWRHY